MDIFIQCTIIFLISLKKFRWSFMIRIQEQGPKDLFPLLHSEISYRRSILIFFKPDNNRSRNTTPLLSTRLILLLHWPTSIYELCLCSLADALSEISWNISSNSCPYMSLHLCGKRPVHRLILQHHVRAMTEVFLIRPFRSGISMETEPECPVALFFLVKAQGS